MTDVLGVVTTFGEVQHFVSQRTHKELVKRDFNIVDDSSVTVNNLLILSI